MKKQIVSLIVLTGIAVSVVAQNSTVTATVPLYQLEFPLILSQPDDQSVPIGSNATFTVIATNGPLAYQWLKNSSAIDGATNNTLTIEGAQTTDVGFYSCNVSGGEGPFPQTVPSRSASLFVFSSSIDPATGVDPVVVFGPALSTKGSSGNCPGPYVGYVSYTKSGTNGWGWAPDTTNGNTLFYAVDTNSTSTKIQYLGEYGDGGCAQTTVTVPNPPMSPVYRFCIYFTNNVPTNAYPITLDGFNP